MIALRAARLFDGQNLVEQPVVVLDGDRIATVGTEPPPIAEVLDLGDATLLPGFVDTHQHLVFNGVGTLEEMVTGVTDEELLERARANALTALRAGVTTIRDLGDKNYLTLPLRDDPELPTLLCSGPPITIDNGHCWYLGGECGPDGLDAAVAQRAERGVDVVKIMVSGGHGTPGYPMAASQFTTEHMHTVVRAAHAHGLPVAAHCHGTPSIISAIEAGVDSIEHCTFINEDHLSEPDDTVFERMIANGVALSSTIGALPGITPPPIIQQNMTTMLDAWGGFVRRGGLLSVGTDAGIAPGKPHDIFPHAFTGLGLMGVPRAEALRTLTANGAQVIGLAGRKGRLAPGYEADVVAVTGDPLTDGDLLDPVGVWLRGTRVVG